MSTFKDDILSAVEGSPIEAVVLGSKGWDEIYMYNEEDERVPVPWPTGEVIPWEEALPFLEYDFDRGYGGPECHAIYVWTKDRVFFVSQYDGSTGIESIPRNPTDELPSMPGG